MWLGSYRYVANIWMEQQDTFPDVELSILGGHL